MFNDAHLPDTEAWTAMTRDLRQSKEGRNALSKENSYVSTVDRRDVMRAAHTFSQTTQAAISRIRIGEGRVGCTFTPTWPDPLNRLGHRFRLTLDIECIVSSRCYHKRG